jgi:GDP-4-dehydro-6-deoxy-D-mannose reductase
MKKALLIGGTGFVGCHMDQLLRADDYEVISKGSSYDIRDKEKITSLVNSCCPDIVINFAFITTVKETFADPVKNFNIGFHGMLNLLLALKENNFKGKLINISSSEVYGFPEVTSLPIIETETLKPMSPYSVVKVAVEALCYQWSQCEEFEIITARPFTHIGPGQSDRFALSSFAKQIAEILLGRKPPVIQVGNLNSTRDITDVRDVVQAYDALLRYGKNGEIYNICSGKEVKMSVLLKQMIANTGLDIRVKEDVLLARNAEQQRLCGNNEKLRNETDWKLKISLEQTLIDMVDDWKRRLDSS